MKIIKEIIEILSSEEGSLTESLLKTKVLLHKIGKKELVNWVNWELNGYSNEEDVPEYRILNAEILADVSNGVYRYSSHPIPLMHLKETWVDKFTTFKVKDSLSVLEEFARKTEKSGGLISRIPMEANGVLGEKLSGGYFIQTAWSQIDVTNLKSIFTQVRSRLLDFILSLDDGFSDDLTDDEAKEQAKKIDTASVFKNAIFGNNTTIIVGDKNVQNVSQNITEGNIEALKELLKKSGIVDTDIAILESALEQDRESKNLEKRDFGDNVKQWMKSMLSKAIDSTWQIEVAVAGNLLTEALKSYYGWG